MNRKAGVGETQNTTQTGYRVKSGLRSLFISFISLTKYNLEKSSLTSIGNSHSLKLGFFLQVTCFREKGGSGPK